MQGKILAKFTNSDIFKKFYPSTFLFARHFGIANFSLKCKGGYLQNISPVYVSIRNGTIYTILAKH